MTSLILLIIAGVAALLLSVHALITQRKISKILSRLESLEKDAGLYPFDDWKNL